MRTLFLNHGPLDLSRFVLNAGFSPWNAIFDNTGYLGDSFDLEFTLGDKSRQDIFRLPLEVEVTSWTCSGLPTGMQLTKKGNSSVKITGTPIFAGTYTVILIPNTKLYGEFELKPLPITFVIKDPKPVFEKGNEVYNISNNSYYSSFDIYFSTKPPNVTWTVTEYNGSKYPNFFRLYGKDSYAYFNVYTSISNPTNAEILTYQFLITATNQYGSATKIITINVIMKAPMLDTTPKTFNIGDNVQLVYGQYLKSGRIVGLPNGLYYSFLAADGNYNGNLRIGGIVSQKAGTYVFTVYASNLVGSTTANITYTILDTTPRISDGQSVNLTYQQPVNQKLKLDKNFSNVTWSILGVKPYSSINDVYPPDYDGMINGIGISTDGTLTGTFNSNWRGWIPTSWRLVVGASVGNVVTGINDVTMNFYKILPLPKNYLTQGASVYFTGKLDTFYSFNANDYLMYGYPNPWTPVTSFSINSPGYVSGFKFNNTSGTVYGTPRLWYTPINPDGDPNSKRIATCMFNTTYDPQINYAKSLYAVNPMGKYDNIQNGVDLYMYISGGKPNPPAKQVATLTTETLDLFSPYYPNLSTYLIQTTDTLESNSLLNENFTGRKPTSWSTKQLPSGIITGFVYFDRLEIAISTGMKLGIYQFPMTGYNQFGFGVSEVTVNVAESYTGLNLYSGEVNRTIYNGDIVAQLLQDKLWGKPAPYPIPGIDLYPCEPFIASGSAPNLFNPTVAQNMIIKQISCPTGNYTMQYKSYVSGCSQYVFTSPLKVKKALITPYSGNKITGLYNTPIDQSSGNSIIYNLDTGVRWVSGIKFNTTDLQYRTGNGKLYIYSTGFVETGFFGSNNRLNVDIITGSIYLVNPMGYVSEYNAQFTGITYPKGATALPASKIFYVNNSAPISNIVLNTYTNTNNAPTSVIMDTGNSKISPIISSGAGFITSISANVNTTNTGIFTITGKYINNNGINSVDAAYTVQVYNLATGLPVLNNLEVVGHVNDPILYTVTGKNIDPETFWLIKNYKDNFISEGYIDIDEQIYFQNSTNKYSGNYPIISGICKNTLINYQQTIQATNRSGSSFASVNFNIDGYNPSQITQSQSINGFTGITEYVLISGGIVAALSHPSYYKGNPQAVSAVENIKNNLSYYISQDTAENHIIPVTGNPLTGNALFGITGTYAVYVIFPTT
jgi:hypothetical protein